LDFSSLVRFLLNRQTSDQNLENLQCHLP
jgi:hypothetical protein